MNRLERVTAEVRDHGLAVLLVTPSELTPYPHEVEALVVGA